MYEPVKKSDMHSCATGACRTFSKFRLLVCFYSKYPHKFNSNIKWEKIYIM